MHLEPIKEYGAGWYWYEIEDDSSWEELEETIEELLESDEVEIVAECERNDL